MLIMMRRTKKFAVFYLSRRKPVKTNACSHRCECSSWGIAGQVQIHPDPPRALPIRASATPLSWGCGGDSPRDIIRLYTCPHPPLKRAVVSSIPSHFSLMLLSLMIIAGINSKKSPSAHLDVYTDGISRGNPGLAAYGFIFVRNNNIIFEESKTIGQTTNNTAEYYAIISALKRIREFAIESIIVYSDSELVIKQINNQYRITKPHLAQLRAELAIAEKNFTDIHFRNVPRENLFIRRCDELCNQALDRETQV